MAKKKEKKKEKKRVDKVKRRNPEQIVEVIAKISKKFMEGGRLKIAYDDFVALSGYKRLPADYSDDVHVLLLELRGLVLFELDECMFIIKKSAVDKAVQVKRSALKKLVG